LDIIRKVNLKKNLYAVQEISNEKEESNMRSLKHISQDPYDIVIPPSQQGNDLRARIKAI